MVFFYLKFGNQTNVLSDGLSHLKKPSFLNPTSTHYSCHYPFSLSRLFRINLCRSNFQANRFVEKTYRRLSKLRLQDVIKTALDKYHFVADILLKAHLSAIQSPHNNPFPYPTFQTAFIVRSLSIIHIASDKFSVYRFQYQANQRNPLKILHYMVFLTNILFRL